MMKRQVDPGFKTKLASVVFVGGLAGWVEASRHFLGQPGDQSNWVFDYFFKGNASHDSAVETTCVSIVSKSRFCQNYLHAGVYGYIMPFVHWQIRAVWRV